MKRFILGMIPSLLVINVFAIASLLSGTSHAYTEIKTDDKAVVYSPVKGVVCVKMHGQELTQCRGMKGVSLLFRYQGQSYNLTEKYLLINPPQDIQI